MVLVQLNFSWKSYITLLFFFFNPIEDKKKKKVGEIILCQPVVCPKNTLLTCGLKISILPT